MVAACSSSNLAQPYATKRISYGLGRVVGESLRLCGGFCLVSFSQDLYFVIPRSQAALI